MEPSYRIEDTTLHIYTSMPNSVTDFAVHCDELMDSEAEEVRIKFHSNTLTHHSICAGIIMHAGARALSSKKKLKVECCPMMKGILKTLNSDELNIDVISV